MSSEPRPLSLEELEALRERLFSQISSGRELRFWLAASEFEKRIRHLPPYQKLLAQNRFEIAAAKRLGLHNVFLRALEGPVMLRLVTFLELPRAVRAWLALLMVAVAYRKARRLQRVAERGIVVGILGSSASLDLYGVLTRIRLRYRILRLTKANRLLKRKAWRARHGVAYLPSGPFRAFWLMSGGWLLVLAGVWPAGGLAMGTAVLLLLKDLDEARLTR